VDFLTKQKIQMSSIDILHEKRNKTKPTKKNKKNKGGVKDYNQVDQYFSTPDTSPSLNPSNGAFPTTGKNDIYDTAEGSTNSEEEKPPLLDEIERPKKKIGNKKDKQKELESNELPIVLNDVEPIVHEVPKSVDEPVSDVEMKVKDTVPDLEESIEEVVNKSMEDYEEIESTESHTKLPNQAAIKFLR
jgi:seryl-tRNA synthetase